MMTNPLHPIHHNHGIDPTYSAYCYLLLQIKGFDHYWRTLQKELTVHCIPPSIEAGNGAKIRSREPLFSVFEGLFVVAS
jgi:hypothetical protein